MARDRRPIPSLKRTHVPPEPRHWGMRLAGAVLVLITIASFAIFAWQMMRK